MRLTTLWLAWRIVVGRAHRGGLGHRGGLRASWQSHRGDAPSGGGCIAAPSSDKRECQTSSRRLPPSAAAALAMNAPITIDSAVKIDTADADLRAVSAT